MRRADPSRGYFMCFLANLALHFWWGAAWFVLLILHFWLDTPWILSWVASAIWVLESLILTTLTYMANQCGQERDPVKQNRNPYSHKTEDMFPAGGDSGASPNQSEEQ